MAIEKTVPSTIDADVTKQLELLTKRVETVNDEYLTKKVNLAMYEKQFAELKQQAKEKGIENLNDLPKMIKDLEQQLRDLLSAKEQELLQAEELLRG